MDEQGLAGHLHLREARRCGSYRPGHEVHWIQAKKSWEEPGVIDTGVIVSLGLTEISMRIGSEERKYWNHDTGRLRETVRHQGQAVVVQERWSLLKVPSPTGHHCFCIARTREAWTECNRGTT